MYTTAQSQNAVTLHSNIGCHVWFLAKFPAGHGVICFKNCLFLVALVTWYYIHSGTMLIYRWRRSSFFDISTEIIASQLRRWPDAGLMLDQRLRRCLNNKAALGQHLVFAACHHVRIGRVTHKKWFIPPGSRWKSPQKNRPPPGWNPIHQCVCCFSGSLLCFPIRIRKASYIRLVMRDYGNSSEERRHFFAFLSRHPMSREFSAVSSNDVMSFLRFLVKICKYRIAIHLKFKHRLYTI